MTQEEKEALKIPKTELGKAVHNVVIDWASLTQEEEEELTQRFPQLMTSLKELYDIRVKLEKEETL